jgi:peroxiredoxin
VPKLNELHEKYTKEGLVLIGVHSDPKTEEGQKVATELAMKYPVAYDGAGKLMKAFKCDSFPDYVIIDHRGTVRAVDLANAEAEKAIKMLLEEKKRG